MSDEEDELRNVITVEQAKNMLRKQAAETFENSKEGDKVQVYDCLPLIAEVSGMKEKGNEKVKNKQFDAASTIYETAILRLADCEGFPLLEEEEREVRTLRAALHCNHSLCMLKLQLFGRAIKSASACLDIENTNMKALHRRSEAHEALGEFEEALRDAISLMKLGGGENGEEMQKRCEKLYERHAEQTKAVNEIGKSNDELFKMKETFDHIFDAYNLEEENASQLVLEWYVASKDNLEETIDKAKRKWKMERTDAEKFVAWIVKGIEMGIISRPPAKI